MRRQTSIAIRLLSVCVYAMPLFTLTSPALAQIEKPSGLLLAFLCKLNKCKTIKAVKIKGNK